MLRRLRLPALTAALALTTLAACGGDDDTAAAPGGTESDIADTDDVEADGGTEGDGEAVLLHPNDGAEVGQAVEQVVTMAMSMSAGGEDLDLTLELAMEVEVVEVDDDGGYRTESVITSIQPSGDDDGAATDAIAQMEPIIGVPMTVDVAADGEPGTAEFADDAPAEARELMAQFGSSIGGAPISFPDEPVAVGDEWSDEIEVASAGVSLPLEADYRLVALDEETWTVELDYGGEIDESGATGDVSSSGTVTGSRTNPLLLDSDIDTEAEIEGDGISISQRIEAAVDSEPAAG